MTTITISTLLGNVIEFDYAVSGEYFLIRGKVNGQYHHALEGGAARIVDGNSLEIAYHSGFFGRASNGIVKMADDSIPAAAEMIAAYEAHNTSITAARAAAAAINDRYDRDYAAVRKIQSTGRA